MIKKTISLLLAVVMLVLISPVSFAAEDVTGQKQINSLDDMIAYAWEHNENLQKLDANIKSIQINLRDAEKAKEDAMEMARLTIGRVGPVQSIETQASIGLVRRGYNLKMVQNEYDMLLERREQIKQTLSLNITKGYIAVLQVRNNRAYMEKMQEKLNKLMEITQLRYKLNMATDLELKNLKNQLEQLNNQLVDIKEKENNIVKDLKRAMNLPDDYELVFTDNFTMNDEDGLNADEVIEKALEKRLDLKQLKNAEELQKLKVDVYGSYYSKASSTYKLEVIALETIQKDVEAKIKDIKNEIEASVKNLELLRDAYNLADLDYQRVVEKHRIDKLKYELGMISYIDMMDSELELMDASNKKKTALYNYISAKLDLDLASTYGTSVGGANLSAAN
ncbi:MAG: TolC family protein [Clostridiaceae bacterium]|nr:TolC family protein [Clostridiaceae bacterium]